MVCPICDKPTTNVTLSDHLHSAHHLYSARARSVATALILYPNTTVPDRYCAECEAPLGPEGFLEHLKLDHPAISRYAPVMRGSPRVPLPLEASSR